MLVPSMGAQGRGEYFQLFPDNHPGIVLKNLPFFGKV